MLFRDVKLLLNKAASAICARLLLGWVQVDVDSRMAKWAATTRPYFSLSADHYWISGHPVDGEVLVYMLAGNVGESEETVVAGLKLLARVSDLVGRLGVFFY